VSTDLRLGIHTLYTRLRDRAGHLVAVTRRGNGQVAQPGMPEVIVRSCMPDHFRHDRLDGNRDGETCKGLSFRKHVQKVFHDHGKISRTADQRWDAAEIWGADGDSSPQPQRFERGVYGRSFIIRHGDGDMRQCKEGFQVENAILQQGIGRIRHADFAQRAAVACA